MPIKSFVELTKKVHLLNDLILSDMLCDEQHYKGERMSFNKNLYTMKYWFIRISWANKRRYLLTLLEDIRSAWALSLLLKAIWNCRPKDAVLSASEYPAWNPYDQVPMDHNRTAMPVKVLSIVMINGRKWFFMLEPEFQAKVITELLSLSGGPIMWEVLRRAQFIFQRHTDRQLMGLLECIVINDQDRKKSAAEVRRSESVVGDTSNEITGKAQKELEANLAAWNSIIKNLRESQKLEEVEMTFVDGTKQKLWKVNRPKPESTETVDMIQLLPAAIGQRILSYLPRASLGEYARVNRYWAFLVEELQAQWAARQKIDNDLLKLQDLMLKHDSSLEVVVHIDATGHSSGTMSHAGTALSYRQPPSLRPSEKSGFSTAALHFEKLKPPVKRKSKPIRRLSDLDNMLEKRGAGDENIWQWCRNVLKYTGKKNEPKDTEGVFPTADMHFPCPLMKYSVPTPLPEYLKSDPVKYGRLVKIRKGVLPNIEYNTKEPAVQPRYSLWSRDFSGLYKVYKVPSYKSPV